MEELGLNINFNLNPEEVAADAEKIKKSIAGAENSASETAAQAASAAKSAAAATRKQVEETDLLKKNIDQLKVQLQFYTNIASKAFDPNVIAAYNKKAEATAAEIKRLQSVGKTGFDDMGNAIGKSENLVGKLWGGLRRIAYIVPGLGIAGILSLALDPLLKLISNWDIFNAKISETIKRRLLLNEVLLKGSQNAQKEVVDLKLLYNAYQNGNLPLDKRKDAYEQLQKLYPAYFGNLKFEATASDATSDAYKRLTSSILATARARAAADKIAENSSRQLDNEQKIKDEEAKIRKYNIRLNAATSTALTNSTKGVQGENVALYDQAIISNINNQIAASQKVINDAKTDSKILNQRNLDLEKNITEQIEKGGKLTGNVGKDLQFNNKELNKALSLQQKIDDLIAGANRKSISPEDEQIQAIKDQFAKITNEVNRFNADPKNKIKVDGSGLPSAEKKAIDNATYKIDTEHLKTELDKQKALFSEYESFKVKTSKEEADKRYASELNGFENYGKLLEAKIKEVYDGAKGGDLTGGQSERLKYLQEQLQKYNEDARKTDDQRYIEAYDAAKTFTQKRLDIEADYHQKVKALGDNATTEQIANLQKIRDEKLQALNSEVIDSETNWAEMFASFDTMSKGAVRKYLDQVRKRVDAERAAGNISAEDYKKRIKEIEDEYKRFGALGVFKIVADNLKKWQDDVKKFGKDSDQAKKSFKELAGSVGEAASTASEAIGTIADSLDSLGLSDDNTQKVLKDVQGMFDGVSQIGKGLATGNPIDVVAGSVKLLASAIDLFNNKDKKLEAKIKDYQNRLKALGEQFKDLDYAVNNSVGEDFYKQSEAEIRNLKQQIQLLQNSIAAERQKKKTDQGKIDEWQSQINDLNRQIQDIQKNVSETILQTNFRDFSNNLADALSSAFAAGEDSAKALDQTFDQVIANMIKNALKLKLLDGPVNDVLNTLTDYLKTHNNDVTGFDFDAAKKKLEAAGKQFTDALAGFGDFFKTDANAAATTNSIQGEIQRITEDTGGIIAGRLAGIQISLIESKEDRKIQSQTSMQMLAEMRSQGLILIKIEQNTNRSATIEEQYLPYLKDIKDSMDDSSALRAGGKGP